MTAEWLYHSWQTAPLCLATEKIKLGVTWLMSPHCTFIIMHHANHAFVSHKFLFLPVWGIKSLTFWSQASSSNHYCPQIKPVNWTYDVKKSHTFTWMKKALRVFWWAPHYSSSLSFSFPDWKNACSSVQWDQWRCDWQLELSIQYLQAVVMWKNIKLQ